MPGCRPGWSAGPSGPSLSPESFSWAHQSPAEFSKMEIDPLDPLGAQEFSGHTSVM